MPETAYDDHYVDGVRVSRIERIVSDAEIERRDAGQQLRQALVALRQWGADSLSAAELGALTAAQRLQRQAVQEQRVATLSRIVLRLIWRVGEDDGS
jgi:hypothetical protein